MLRLLGVGLAVLVVPVDGLVLMEGGRAEIQLDISI